MAITGGDIASATDPFVLALGIAFSSTFGDLANDRILLIGSEGFLNGIIDKDVQDIFWQHDANPDISFPVAAMETNLNVGPAATGDEFGSFEQDIGSGTFKNFLSADMIEQDPKVTKIYVTGRSAGATLYSLFAYIAFAWTERDPAQILFSWIAHYLDNSVFDMRDFIDQTSFSNASDYYDLNNCKLSVVRESGKAIADQAKSLFEHTADFVGIVPDAATGAVKMRIFVRGALDDRTTPIDLNSKSVKSYTVRPTDRYRVDRLDAHFGSIVMVETVAAPNEGSSYITGFPVEFPQANRTLATQKVGGASAETSVELSLPYHQTRDRLSNHLDLRYWSIGQDEVEIEFADWSHFNFESGDVVHMIGESYDGTEDFVVTEKTLDIDELTASARFLQIRGHKGDTPKDADSANLLFNLRPNELGYFVEGSTPFPKQVALLKDPRNLDRWFDASGHYCHATQINRGTGGPAGANPSPPYMVLDAVNRWPALEFDGLSGMKQARDLTRKLYGPSTSGVTCDYTFYAVIRVDDVAALLDTVWNYAYSGSSISLQIVSGVPKYNSGSGSVGSGTALAGWQIIVWTLKAAALSTIRRNGVQLHSAGAYTRVALNTSGDFSIGCNYAGSTNQFDGAIAELAMFKTAHDLATTQAIELHLSEKYGIAI